MGAPSTTAVELLSPAEAWVQERRIVSALLRTAFGVAGILWLLLYVIELDPAQRAAFVQRQYQLYLVLLTLWGYDYRRQSRRLEYLVQRLSEQRSDLPALRWSDVVSDGQSSLFDVLWWRSGSRARFPVVFTWLLLIGAGVLLALQLSSIVAAVQR